MFKFPTSVDKKRSWCFRYFLAVDNSCDHGVEETWLYEPKKEDDNRNQ
jgi:hypothetical protein